jgi:hypothetical protein
MLLIIKLLETIVGDDAMTMQAITAGGHLKSSTTCPTAMMARFRAIIVKADTWGIWGCKRSRRGSLYISSIRVHRNPLPDLRYAMFAIRSRRRTFSAVRSLASETGFCLQRSSLGLCIIAAGLADA